jgi:hypothetical protein
MRDARVYFRGGFVFLLLITISANLVFLSFSPNKKFDASTMGFNLQKLFPQQEIVKSRADFSEINRMFNDLRRYGKSSISGNVYIYQSVSNNVNNPDLVIRQLILPPNDRNNFAMGQVGDVDNRDGPNWIGLSTANIILYPDIYLEALPGREFIMKTIYDEILTLQDRGYLKPWSSSYELRLEPSDVIQKYSVLKVEKDIPVFTLVNMARNLFSSNSNYGEPAILKSPYPVRQISPGNSDPGLFYAGNFSNSSYVWPGIFSNLEMYTNRECGSSIKYRYEDIRGTILKEWNQSQRLKSIKLDVGPNPDEKVLRVFAPDLTDTENCEIMIGRKVS